MEFLYTIAESVNNFRIIALEPKVIWRR